MKDAYNLSTTMCSLFAIREGITGNIMKILRPSFSHCSLLPHVAIFAFAVLAAPAFGGHPGKGEDEDPYNLLPPPGAMRDTAGEQFLGNFTPGKAAEYLDLRRHNIESNCYACHSSGAYMAARPLLDPLALGVMETRVLMQRFAADFTSKPPLDRVKSGAVERAQRILTAVEMARHDAVSTGKLHPLTRKALDHVWAFQLDDGGFHWVPFAEAPSAIDHHWGVTLVALGAAAAPDGYAQTEPAKNGIAKLRGWFQANAPKDLHERGLTVIADWAVGGILTKTQREEHIAAFFAKQQPTHGWSTGTLSVHPQWKRPDGQPLDVTRSDSYATAFAVYVLARAGVPPTDERLKSAIEWLQNSQRETGGYYTFSPRKKDILASYQATGMAIQALSAVGVLPLPKKVTQEQFDTAYATADKLIAPGVMKPNSAGKQARDAKMTMSGAKAATPVSAKAPSASADKAYPEAKTAAAITDPKQLADRALVAIGGAEKVLRQFSMEERFMTGMDLGTGTRTWVISLPDARWELPAGVNRTAAANDVALNLTAGWTLAILSHPKTQLSPLAPIKIAGRELDGFMVSGSTGPTMHLHFDRDTGLLGRIGYAGVLYFPSDYQTTTDGVKHPGRIVATSVKGEVLKSWQITKVNRLPELPANLKRSEIAAAAPPLVKPAGKSAQTPAADAKALANKILASHGGADKLLRTFKFTEVYLLAGRDKGTERTSTLQPPNLWYVGKTERVSEQNKGGVCHDVWMWTLAPLVDPKTKLEALPDATIEGKAAHALKVSGSIEPPMNVFFDASTDDLVKIEWKGEQFLFTAPMTVDGTRVPSKCVLLGKSGKERMRTELKKIERLPELPADLPKPESK